MRDVEDSEGRQMPPLLVDLAAGREPAGTALDASSLSLANEHRMTGLLWTWARRHPTDPELKTTLARDDLAVQAHLVRVWKVLEVSVARLAAAGIDVAAIKGVTAEARWYGRRGERPCSDVDLLLSPHQLDRVGDAVALLEPEHPWLSQVVPLATSGQIQGVTTHVDGLEVDLHLDLFKLGMPTRQAADIWSLTSAYPLPGGINVPVLDDTTALVHLLIHLNKDRFQRLLGYADIARVIAAGGVNWDRFERFIRVEGLRVPALMTLGVVLDELGLPWPSAVQRPRDIPTHLWQMIWPPRVRLRGAEGRLRYRKRQAWIAFLARGRSREALYWWLRELWPPAPVVNARYANITGPYFWKLLRGRISAARARREQLAMSTKVVAPNRRPLW